MSLTGCGGCLWWRCALVYVSLTPLLHTYVLCGLWACGKGLMALVQLGRGPVLVSLMGCSKLGRGDMVCFDGLFSIAYVCGIRSL
jgi:hypothetical protein